MAAEQQFERLIRLLELESAAEAERLLTQAGRLSDDDAERIGKTLVTSVIRDGEVPLDSWLLLAPGKRDGRWR